MQDRQKKLTEDLQDIANEVTRGKGQWLDLPTAWQAVASIERQEVITDPLANFKAMRPLNELLDRLQGTDTVALGTDPSGDVYTGRKPGKYCDGYHVHAEALQHLIAQKVQERMALEALASGEPAPATSQGASEGAWTKDRVMAVLKYKKSHTWADTEKEFKVSRQRIQNLKKKLLKEDPFTGLKGR